QVCPWNDAKVLAAAGVAHSLLVHFLNGGAAALGLRVVSRSIAGTSSSRKSAGESTGHSTTGGGARLLVELRHDGIANGLEFLAVVLELVLLIEGIRIQPLHRLLDLVENLLAIRFRDL